MKPTILIIGAGFAGMWSALSAARLLDLNGRSEQVRIQVLAPQAELQVRPRFYEPQVEALRAPLGELFAAVGVEFVQGAACDIDHEGRRVSYRDAQGQTAELAYDRLVLAAGSQIVRSEALADGFDVDQLEQASKLERHLHNLAHQPDSVARNTVVVAGGGFTGIEVAAEMPARLRKILGEQADIRVIVVDRGRELGAALGGGPRPMIEQAMNELGVQWHLGASVEAVDADGVTLSSGERIDSHTVILTTGVRANPLAAQLPGAKDAQDRIVGDDQLRVSGCAGVFATGDMVRAATDDDGHFNLMSCQHAIALGRYAGHNAAADLLGQPLLAYRQPKYVTCLDLGPWGAIFCEGWDRQVQLSHAEGKAIKTQINTVWIYPPQPARAVALAAADPAIPVVA